MSEFDGLSASSGKSVRSLRDVCYPAAVDPLQKWGAGAPMPSAQQHERYKRPY
jgi:hypothetical protein